ncbi:hypothetical protein QE408_003417 [Agrobacterium larrymoorei]|uniref:Uncharacterized protein n=1 Tax=Agrobacterium larrymoorei TaxID=160699 RepID=A0ABU0UMT6_9HYPH|nr:hypothetical protein [Agrobacterium larrymoorei]
MQMASHRFLSQKETLREEGSAGEASGMQVAYPAAAPIESGIADATLIFHHSERDHAAARQLRLVQPKRSAAAPVGETRYCGGSSSIAQLLTNEERFLTVQSRHQRPPLSLETIIKIERAGTSASMFRPYKRTQSKARQRHCHFVALDEISLREKRPRPRWLHWPSIHPDHQPAPCPDVHRRPYHQERQKPCAPDRPR